MEYRIQAHELNSTGQNFIKLTKKKYVNDVFSYSYKFELNPITGRVEIDVQHFPRSHSRGCKLFAGLAMQTHANSFRPASDCTVENIGDNRRRCRPFP